MNLNQAPYKKGDKVRHVDNPSRIHVVVFGTLNFVHVYVNGMLEIWPVEECERVTE